MRSRIVPRSSLPLGFTLVRLFRKKDISYPSCQASVLILTFFAYTLYHLSRKPFTIVKSTLTGDGVLLNNISPLRPDGLVNRVPWHLFRTHSRRTTPSATRLNATISSSGWAPFDGDSGTSLLGEIDVAFLAVYAFGTFFSGHIGDRVSLRRFLVAGMVSSGICTCLFGMAYWWNVHWLPYFFIVQILSGLFQSTGWPSVVAVMGNWFGKERRGLIMGVWNAHTSIGNLSGSLIASSLLDEGWGWSFVVPGLSILVGAGLIFLFLLEHPNIIGLPSPHESLEDTYVQQQILEDEESGLCKQPSGNIADEERNCKTKEDEKAVPLLVDYNSVNASLKRTNSENLQAVGFFQALTIPGVIPFALCLFFAKLVSYTILYWLPYYIQDTEIGGEYLSDETAGNASTLYDVGGIVGGILAGHLSDNLNAKATTAASFAYCAIPALAFYRVFGGSSLWMNMGLLSLCGLLVNGPYALITTAVSAELGTHESVKGNARALATVTAIIDGTGSVGAAIGPLVTGYISEAAGWNAVFLMLSLSSFVSGLLLTKEVISELKTRRRRR